MTYTAAYYQAKEIMNLVLLTPQVPFPPYQGTAIRNWAILRHLAKQHKVTLLTFDRGGSNAVPNEIRAVCQAVHVVRQPERSIVARLPDAAFRRG